MRRLCALGFAVLLAAVPSGFAQTPSPSPSPDSADFAREAAKLRQQMIFKTLSQMPTLTATRQPPFPSARKSPWKTNIVTEVFRIEGAGAWDPQWQRHYGGVDSLDPAARRNYIPMKFTPRQNPFYCELPYNDLDKGATKPEAPVVIPWFKQAYRKFGQSVCQNQWVEIRTADGRTCYAQWTDCGPRCTDDWAYVFGPAMPEPNSDQGAGLGVSPAVRDFLKLHDLDVTSWRFVDYRDVPLGAWSDYGENNDFVKIPRGPKSAMTQ